LLCALVCNATPSLSPGLPRSLAAAAATAPLCCSSFAAGKQEKRAGKTKRVKNESEKREREEAQEAEMLKKKYKAEEAADITSSECVVCS